MQPIAFGKYLLVERLAQGGMAEVFRAGYQGGHGFEKQVAVKRILPVFDGAADFVDMFVDEARIASSLTHVNIVQVSDFGELDGTYYLAMELVDGVDLGRLRESASRRGLRIPVPIVAYVIAEAARGLAYAHDKRGGDGPGGLGGMALKALEGGREGRCARAADLARELSAWLSSAAPSLTREDVGAFVGEVIPREAGSDSPPPADEARQQTAPAPK